MRRTPRRAALLGAAAVLALVLTGLGGFAVGAATDDRAGAGHRGEHGPAEPGERDDRGGGRGGR